MIEKKVRSSFHTEIEEQGKALRRMITFYKDEGRILLKEWEDISQNINGDLIFTGMGTSYYTPFVIKPLLNSEGVKTSIFEAGEFLHYGLNTVGRDDILVLISQSGESFETCQVARKLKNICKLIAIVNEEESELARSAELVLPLKAGKEESITSKTYTNSLGLLNIMGVVAVSEEFNKETDSLMDTSKHLDSFFQTRLKEITNAEEHIKEATTLHFLSRGPSMVGAFQGALTFMEGALMTTMAMPCGSFRHGPFELAGNGHHAIVYIPSLHTREIVEHMVSEMAEKGSRILSFSAGLKERVSPRIFDLAFPDVEDRHLPIAAAAAQELLLERVASKRGLICGVYRHGAKVTKRE